MDIKKSVSILWLLAIAGAALFLFNPTPMPPTEPDMLMPDLPAPSTNTTALYTQVLVSITLLLGSAVLMLARKYEHQTPALIGAGIVGVCPLLLGIGLILFDWVPSETLSPSFGLVAIAAACAGPVLQLTAPDKKVLSELADLRADLNESEDELSSSEAEIQKLQGTNKNLADALKSARSEAGVATEQHAKAMQVAQKQIASLQGHLQDANARADIAVTEKAAADSARHDAESAQAAAEAEAATLRERTAHAEEHAARAQVRLNAFEERKVADIAAADLIAAEATLAATKQRVSSLLRDLQTAEAEEGRLQTAYNAALSTAENAWSAVNEAATVALSSEVELAEAQKASDLVRAAVASEVKILDSDGIEQKLSDAEAAYAEATETLARLNTEARSADVSAGTLVADLKHAEITVSDLTSDLEAAQTALEAAKIAVDEALKVSETAKVEAIAAERRFTALVSAERQSAEMATQVAAEQAEKSALVAQNDELKAAIADALKASGCALSLVRLAADEDTARYRVILALPQEHEITFAVRIADDEGADMLFRTIPAGQTACEPFDIDRGYNTNIKVLPPQGTAEALGTNEVAAYLVA